MNKTKENIVIKLISAAKIFLIITIVAVIIIVLKCCTTYASEKALERYNTSLSQNQETIKHCDETKRQLHITAELLRKDAEPDVELIERLSQKWYEYNEIETLLTDENTQLQTKINKIVEDLNKPKFIGYFTITHYDICYKCCGKHPGDKGYGITASGTHATPGRTIAVDPKVIPIGSEVIVGGKSYIAEDTGGAIKGNKIDICVASHTEGIQKGTLYNLPVYIVRK